MRFTTLLTACAIALLNWSCGAAKTADSQNQTSLAPQQQYVASAAPALPAAPAPSHAAAKQIKSDNFAPPSDVQWTIIVKIIPGPGHVEKAKQLKDELAKASGMNKWYVTHEEEQSTLYYGYYRAFDESIDPAETARLRDDRAKIAALADQVGNHPFKDAMPVLINSPDPTAPPEYNLVNAKGYWSLDIAAYQGPGRKEAAVAAVLAARKMGVEAYYHHGPNVSEVCVGAWPEEAVRKQELDGSSVVDPADRDRPILLLGPGTEVPEALKKQYENNLIDRKTGKQVEVVEQKVDPVDLTLARRWRNTKHIR